MFRRVIKKDFEKITNLECIIFKEQLKQDPCEKVIKKCCHEATGWVYDDNGIKAYLLFCLKKKSAYIFTIAVLEEYRGKGLARELINYIFKNINVPIFLHVQVNNFNALKLYLNLGFKIINITLNRFDNQDAYLCRYNHSNNIF